MNFLRTPENRFLNSPDYPSDRRYVEVPDTEGGKLRTHYVDEGPAKGLPHKVFPGGIHFIQEQYGPELARIMNEFIKVT